MNLYKNFCLIICAFQVAAEFSPDKDVLFIIRTLQQIEGSDNAIKFKDMKSLEASGIDPKKPTIIQIHEYNEDHKNVELMLLSEDLLEATDRNLIFVDWTAGRTLLYKEAQKNVDLIGKTIAEQLDFMNEKIGLNISTVTIIGFSLGAHVAGFVGKQTSRGKIGMIVGLDPAGPLFDINNPRTRLDASDGDYVIALHTSGISGIRKSLAHADFFFNTGEKQPGCKASGQEDLCSHLRVVVYYKEAVKMPKSFLGIRCSSESQALTGKCSDEPNAFLGDPKFAKGIFSVETNSRRPFGTGQPE